MRLRDHLTWDVFRRTDNIENEATYSHLDRYDMETWVLKLANHPTGPWKTQPTLERPLVKERIVLRLYSGRRRRGDFQEFMELFAAARPDCQLYVVSIDIVVGPNFGDVRNKATKQYWLSAIRAGYVLALLAGPSCNTWSAARAHPLSDAPQRAMPRVARTKEEMWGAASLSLRELRDVSVGNELLIFTLLAFIYLYISQGFAIVEHPAAPRDEQAASI